MGWQRLNVDNRLVLRILANQMANQIFVKLATISQHEQESADRLTSEAADPEGKLRIVWLQNLRKLHKLQIVWLRRLTPGQNQTKETMVVPLRVTHFGGFPSKKLNASNHALHRRQRRRMRQHASNHALHRKQRMQRRPILPFRCRDYHTFGPVLHLLG